MSTVKRVLKIIAAVILIIVLLAACLIGYLSLNEYDPPERESVPILGTASHGGSGQTGRVVAPGDSVRIMTWNVGYGALGDNADFFMDGGSSVMTADDERVNENLSSIASDIRDADPDILMLQEVDRDSKRSHNINEEAFFVEKFGDYSHTFASNFKVLYVPYPIPPIGKVDSGIMTLSAYKTDWAQRVSLPCPFSWPMRTANLKRCLLISRMPVEGTNKHLVIINFHLEAYDSGEGKILQTNVLKNILKEELAKGNYVIAGGDLNQTLSTVDMSKYPADEDIWVPGIIDVNEFENEWTLYMDDRIPTCRSLDKAYEGADKDDFLYYMIDGFIVSGNITVNSLETKDMGFLNTDHNPVVMDITLNAE
jgi:endonuclease/exonuclease/phosphatase family metal-dependent hydrolase